jgi:hypothetical protein
VPRIDAPTVAEHHRRRRAALVAAGTDLLADGGVDAVTLGAVGAATGLARSTLRLRRAVARAASPRDRVDAYVVTALDLATRPAHRSLYALAGAGLPEQCRARITELHEEQLAPLREAVAEIGVLDPDLSTRLLVGVLQSAARAVAEGAPKTRVKSEVLAFVHQGIAGVTTTA